MESQRVRRDLACMHSSSAVVAQGPSHPAPHGILPDQGLNALAGGFPPTEPPGTSQQVFIEPLLCTKLSWSSQSDEGRNRPQTGKIKSMSHVG